MTSRKERKRVLDEKRENLELWLEKKVVELDEKAKMCNPEFPNDMLFAWEAGIQEAESYGVDKAKIEDFKARVRGTADTFEKTCRVPR